MRNCVCRVSVCSCYDLKPHDAHDRVVGLRKPVHCFKPKTYTQQQKRPLQKNTQCFSGVVQRCRLWDADKSTCVFDLSHAEPEDLPPDQHACSVSVRLLFTRGMKLGGDTMSQK